VENCISDYFLMTKQYSKSKIYSSNQQRRLKNVLRLMSGPDLAQGQERREGGRIWFDSFYVRVSTMTAILTVSHILRSTTTNGHRFIALGLP